MKIIEHRESFEVRSDVGLEWAEMRLQKSVALQALVVLLLYPSAARAGPCDSIQFTINPQLDRRELLDCIKELKSEIFVLRLQVQTGEALNSLMRNNLCLLAMDIKTENAASIAEIACEELKARVAEKKKTAPGGSKPKKP
jgi:hypothetical protein